MEPLPTSLTARMVRLGGAYHSPRCVYQAGLRQSIKEGYPLGYLPVRFCLSVRSSYGFLLRARSREGFRENSKLGSPAAECGPELCF